LNYKLSGKARKTARAILKAKANQRGVVSHHALLDFVNPRILNFFWSEEVGSNLTNNRQTGRK
jgi:hypothetical protein